MSDLERMARWAIRDWLGHVDFDDMLAEAYLAAWTGYRKALSLGVQSPLAYATRCAGRGPTNWLRKWHGREDHSPDRYRMKSLSIEDLLADADVSDTPAGPAVIVLLSIPGPETFMPERVDAERLTDRLLVNCTDCQRGVIYRLIWLQESKHEAAQALGISVGTVKQHWYKAVHSCREWVKP